MRADSIWSRTDRLARWQIGAAALVAIAIAGVLAVDVWHSPRVPFLLSGDAPWIVARTPLQTNGMVIDRAHPPLSLFETRFSGDGRGARVILRVRGLSDVAVALNGEQLPLPVDPARWKETTSVDVTTRILPGENRVGARVVNPVGNPALQLRIDGLAKPVVSDTDWLSAWEGDPVDHAALAEDSFPHPESEALPAVFPSLRAKAASLALLAAGAAAVFTALVRRPRTAAWAPAVATVVVTAFWLVLFRGILRLPASVGFDAAAHIDYVDWLLAKHALPTPADGLEMYHPPLFHALAALLLAALRPLGVGDHFALSLLPIGAGLGMAWVARAMTRRLVPGRPWLEATAIAVAGLLPVNLTVASCISNEAPHALLVSVALLATVAALLRESAAPRDDVLLGVLLAAALLTKYTALLWTPLLIGALGAKRVLVERMPVPRALLRALGSLGLVVALTGWLYLRNWRLSGDPLVWNLDASPDTTWWQLPGFHTAAYFSRFGASLDRPWFSSFYSFWDSLYSTFWGDGLLSGAISPGVATHRWNYEWMAACFALAVPATLLLAAGWLDVARRSLTGEPRGARIAFSLLFLMPPILLGTLASGILHYPFWSGAKAFYLLALTPTLGLFAALGFAQLDARLARAPLAIRALPPAWAGAFAAAIALSFAT